jgi:hypothetical protein
MLIVAGFLCSMKYSDMYSIKWVVFFCLSSVFAGCQFPGHRTIAPFATDGCSDFPDGTPAHKDLWRKCCVAHDLKYWAGGSVDERMNADLELRVCVRSVGEPAIADLMLAGVRVGGSPWWPTRFRWGYGWPYSNGYSKLNQEETEQVLRQKEKQNLN